MKGKKITTKPVTYEIEILDIEKAIPIENEIEFIEWLSDQPQQLGVGKHHESFPVSDDWQQDIWITFYIKTVPNK